MRLAELAKVLRSKNAGPFLMTFDVLFANDEDFTRVREEGRLTVDSVAKAYGVSPNEVMDFDYYAFARAVKFTLRRPVSSGGPGDNDVYGAQQHVPLGEIEVLS